MVMHLFLIACLAAQALAFPYKWDEKGICESPGPSKGYKGHGNPIKDADVTFVLKSGTDEVTTWTPSKKHTLVVSYPAPAHFWVITNIGTFSYLYTGCDDMSAWNLDIAASVSIDWQAPKCCNGPVEIGATAAQGSTDNYRQSTVTIDCAPDAIQCGAPAPGAKPPKNTPPDATATPPPADAPTEVAEPPAAPEPPADAVSTGGAPPPSPVLPPPPPAVRIPLPPPSGGAAGLSSIGALMLACALCALSFLA